MRQPRFVIILQMVENNGTPRKLWEFRGDSYPNKTLAYRAFRKLVKPWNEKDKQRLARDRRCYVR